METLVSTVTVNNGVFHRNGLKYKINDRGFVMVWVNGEWIRSTTPKSDLVNAKQLRRTF